MVRELAECSRPLALKNKKFEWGDSASFEVSTAFSNLDYGDQNMTVKLDREFNYRGKIQTEKQCNVI